MALALASSITSGSTRTVVFKLSAPVPLTAKESAIIVASSGMSTMA